MSRRFRLPMFVVAAALLGLILLLATLQYRWLGQISAAERQRMQASLASSTAGFAMEFDREITRAYLTFQLEPVQEGENVAARLSEHFERWQGTSRYPKLVKDVHLISTTDDRTTTIQRFDPTTRFVQPADWPADLAPIRAQLETTGQRQSADRTTVVFKSIPSLWEEIPAIVIASPMIVFTSSSSPHLASGPARPNPAMRYTVVRLDPEYISGELLPGLAQQYFRSEGTDYDLAVISAASQRTVFGSAAAVGTGKAAADASVDLFQVKPQEFSAMSSEVRRMTSFFSAQVQRSRSASDPSAAVRGRAEVRQMFIPGDPSNRVEIKDAPLSILLHATDANAEGKRALETGMAAAAGTRPAMTSARWKLVVRHPAGSLETAVAHVRRRNLLVSTGILGILGLSVGFLVVSTRRAQDLAKQQMEFVAAVSHELRTPLAVIRSAADNLADGVVHGDHHVRRYGELVRGEGRRLSEMVEQILELSGIHSGQRGFALRPVAVLPLLHDVVRSSATLIDDAGMQVEFEISETLPPVLGDEQALRRVFQNLVGNAIKYGAKGGWIGVRAHSSGREVVVTVADRGIGIAAADQAHIFEPFYRAPGVIEAQIQGAGLGLSLVQRIVEAHSGRIAVKSAPGEGSEFSVHLPAASEEPVTRESGAHDPAPVHRA